MANQQLAILKQGIHVWKMKNLIPRNSVDFQAIFLVPPDKKDNFANEWKTLMFDRKFVGHFLGTLAQVVKTISMHI